MIFGNKNFNYNNISLTGDFTRFFSENPDLKTGTFIEQSLKLRVTGDITPGVGINAVFDDTKVQNDNREITLFLRGKRFDGSVGNILTSFNFSDMIFYNKKTEGFEIKSKNDRLYLLYARSQGKINSEVFTGKGNQQEYRLFYYPVVSGSETIFLDSRKLERGIDYEIDYEDGTIYFETEVLPIESSSNIFVNYQFEEDEEAFKRYIYGGAYVFSLGRRDVTAGFNFFSDKDSKKSMIEDSSLTLKPSSHENYSFYSKVFRRNLNLYFEKAFSEQDKNLLSDDTLPDRPLKSQWTRIEGKFFRNSDFIAVKSSERDPGFEIIGKKETDVRIDEIVSIFNIKREKYSVSYENTDYDSIIYNDPFLNIDENNVTSFANSRESLVFSTGNRRNLRGNITEENKESSGNNYKSVKKDFVMTEKFSDNFSFKVNFYEEKLEDKKTSVFSKNIRKKGIGFDNNISYGKIAYFYEDIDDMGKDIRNHDLNWQLYKDKFNSFISFKKRKEPGNSSNVGDFNVTWNISDFLSIGARYNSGVLLEIKDSTEINIENRLYNYRVDNSSDIYDLSLYYNRREKINRVSSIRENKNEMYNIDISYDPYSHYNYRLRGTDIRNENSIENSTFSERTLRLEISRNIDTYTSLILACDYMRKRDSRSPLSEFTQTGPVFSLKKNGTRLEYSFSVESGEKDYLNSADSRVTVFGEEVKYNIDDKTNIRYSFKIRDEKKGISRKKLDDELSYNRNVGNKSVLKIFVRRKDVPEDEGGKSYSFDHTGITFDTNF